jgi:type II restriction enzyme
MALGMTPSKKWDGSYIVNAGHLIVNKHGQVVCLLFDHRDVFREYLFLNTKFDRGSRTRHNYGAIRRNVEGLVFLDLNLQIRFIK